MSNYEDINLDIEHRAILDIIQSDFPISPSPYADIGQKLGLNEEFVFKKVQELKKNKIIRRLGANFQSAKLGFRSTLCAAKVSQDKLDEFIQTVNSYSGVTHNYLRAHEYNIWFTLIAENMEQVESILAEITAKTGIAILNLPATKLYKIRVDFSMSN